MAYQGGTATNYLDLLDKVRAFAVAQGWTVDRWTGGNELIMHSPDGVYVGAQAYYSTPGDYYNWKLNGYTSYGAGIAWESQAGAIGATATLPRLHLWNSSTPYWLVCDSRRIILIAKVSTVYESCYLGHIDAYGSPGQYDYPLLIAGTSTSYGGERWSTTGWDHSFFADPSAVTMDAQSTARLRYPDGSWRSFANQLSGGSDAVDRIVWPTGRLLSFARIITPDLVTTNALDDSYWLCPLVLMADTPATAVWGELRGVFWLTGYANAAENTVTIGADTYLVFPNVYRSGSADYAALKLA